MKASRILQADASSLPRSRLPLWAWLLFGGVLVGTLDLAFAAGFWWLRSGVAPIRIPQSIASWVLGREAALSGGIATAMLGMALYYYLTTAMVTGYHRLAQRHPLLLQRPLTMGALYGIALYALLFKVAVPLWSAAAPRPEPLEWTLACIVAYALLIGIPAALFARRWHERQS
ncbi:hypothetical protein [Lysobacter niastensis]|uniref:DUF2569 domain-containing protein n=1 Tax=Lysobacter niastensis TaxID=380629 RepID=A0ABS0BDM4_9GAMM|nr:hypothetical protein [Lysobacter niastensis]MBF6025804.1 hypothetical protein [Lysobacter niastensis]